MENVAHLICEHTPDGFNPHGLFYKEGPTRFPYLYLMSSTNCMDAEDGVYWTLAPPDKRSLKKYCWEGVDPSDAVELLISKRYKFIGWKNSILLDDICKCETKKHQMKMYRIEFTLAKDEE